MFWQVTAMLALQSRNLRAWPILRRRKKQPVKLSVADEDFDKEPAQGENPFALLQRLKSVKPG